MGTFNTFYINASNLASASAVYTDEEMTTLAPSGYYSDGNVIRQQLSTPNAQGQILMGDVSNTCQSCTTSCSDEVVFSAPSDFTGPSTLRGSVSFGSDTGAIKVEIRGVSTKPIGVDLNFNSVKYNGFASNAASTIQLYEAPSPTVTSYFWTQSSGGTSNCSNWNSTLISVAKLHFNSASGLWEQVGNANVLVNNKLATGFSSYNAGSLIRYIPKTTVANNYLDVEFVLPCGSSGSGVGPLLSVGCPQALTLITTTTVHSAGHSNACNDTTVNVSRYIGPVRSDTSGVLAVGDFIFNNSNASITTADGYYKAAGSALEGVTTSFGSFRVENGLVTEMQNC